MRAKNDKKGAPRNPRNPPGSGTESVGIITGKLILYCLLAGEDYSPIDAVLEVQATGAVFINVRKTPIYYKTSLNK